MIDPNAATPEGAAAPIGAGEALLGVIASPKSTFERIAAAKSWSFLLPFILLLVVSGASMVVFMKRADMEAFTREQIRKSPFTSQMTPQMIDEAAKQAAHRPATLTVALTVAGVAVMYVVIAAVFWLAFLAVGSGMGFLGSLRVVCWAQIVTILRALLAIVVMELKDPTYLDPSNLVATNLGAILGHDRLSPALYSLLSSLDIATFWLLWLYATGFSAAGSVKQKKSAAVVITLYAVVVLVQVGWSLLQR